MRYRSFILRLLLLPALLLLILSLLVSVLLLDFLIHLWNITTRQLPQKSSPLSCISTMTRWWDYSPHFTIQTLMPNHVVGEILKLRSIDLRLTYCRAPPPATSSTSCPNPPGIKDSPLE